MEPSAKSRNGGDLAEDEHVMSEVHLGCPFAVSGSHTSLFTFSLPETEPASTTVSSVQLDDDGDLVLTRRKKTSGQCFHLAIEHNVTSSITNVGLQVWRAEFLLADFLLHKMLTSSELDGIVSLELGAGTGLAGMLLARVAKTVFLTDHGDEILKNCSRNVDLNADIFSNKATVHVRELDWMNSWPPETCLEESPTFNINRHSWTSSEVEEAQEASLLVAADVIYGDDLTMAFFQTVDRLMRTGSEKVLYLALEKRYNFSLNDLDIVANGYAHFRSYMGDEQDSEGGEVCSTLGFVGEHVDIAQIPQYAKEYERGKDVELWKITLNKKQRFPKEISKLHDVEERRRKPEKSNTEGANSQTRARQASGVLATEPPEVVLPSLFKELVRESY